MSENKAFLVFAFPVTDLTVARYLAARSTDYIGIPIDLENLKKSQNVILQFREWLEGPKLIGIINNHDVPSMPEALDGFYHPEQSIFYLGKLDIGLSKFGKPEEFHDALYQILDNPHELNEPFNGFLELELHEDPNNFKEYKGFVIHPGYEMQTGIYDFEMLDTWFDQLDFLQKKFAG